MIKSLQIPIIGVHHSPLSQKFGIPRQPNLVDIKTTIELYPPYNNPQAVLGLEGFSHIWLTWQSHHNSQPKNFRPLVRPPRLGGNDKLGVFATRSVHRPSGLGLSVVQLQQITVIKGKVWLEITGADMVDGTPIIDIKPYLPYSDSLPDAMGGFAHTAPNNKKVIVATDKPNDVTDNDCHCICQLIAQDPRPAYRHNEINIECVMRYGNYDVHFVMNKCGELVIVGFTLIS